jgi:WD40 repeat protein
MENEKRDRAATLLKLFRAFFRLGARTGDDKGRAVPLILVIDDAQWADRDTLYFCEELYRSAVEAGWPMLVLCTHWPREWNQAKQDACTTVRDGDSKPETLAEVCHRLCQRLGVGVARPPGICCLQADSAEKSRHTPLPAFNAPITGNIDSPSDPHACHLYWLDPVDAFDLRVLLKQAIPGTTGPHARKIMNRVGGAPAFLLELINYVLQKKTDLIDGDPQQGFSENGIKRVLNMTGPGHQGLIDTRFLELDASVQEAIGHASFLDVRFLRQLLVETGSRAKAGFTEAELELAHVPYAIIQKQEPTELISAFTLHAWFERAALWLRERIEDEPQIENKLRMTLVQILSEWRDQGRMAALPANERYEVLRLFERELGVLQESPFATGAPYVLLENIRAERKQLEKELGLPDRARATDQRRAQVQTGHYGGITAIAWAPDERWIATGGGEGGDILIWSTETVRPVLQIDTEHMGGMHQLVVSPDGNSLLSVSRSSNFVSVWNTATGELRYRLTHHRSPVQSVVSGPDKAWFTTASGKEFVVWDWETGTAVFGQKYWWPTRWSPFRELVVVPGKGLLAVLGSHGLFLWDPADGAMRGTRPAGKMRFWRQQRTLTASVDGRWLAWAVFDLIVLWDTEGQEQPKILDRDTMQKLGDDSRADVVYGLGFDPKGRWLAASSDGLVQLFSLPGGELFREISGNWVHHDLWGPSFAVGSKGDWVATAGSGGNVNLLDPTGLRSSVALTGQHEWVQVLATSPSGHILAGAGTSSTLALWDTASGDLLHCTPVHRRPILDLAMAPDGAWLASAGRESIVRVWSLDASHREPVRQQEVYDLARDSITDRIEAIAASPDGAWLAVGKVRDHIRIWRLGEDKVEDTEISFDKGKTLLVLNNALHIVTVDTFDVKVWNLNQPKPVYSFQRLTDTEHVRFEALAADQNSRWIAAAGYMVSDVQDQGALWLWDIDVDKRLCLVKGIVSLPFFITFQTRWQYFLNWFRTRLTVKHRRAGAMRAIIFASDGSWLASAGESGKVWIWDPNKASRRYVFDDPSHKGSVYALAAAPDSTWVASAGEDATIRFWHIEGCRHLYTLRSGKRPIRALVVAPDGKVLFSAGDDGLIRRWTLPDRLDTQPICDLAMQPLPEGDWVVWGDPEDEQACHWIEKSSGADRWLKTH